MPPLSRNPLESADSAVRSGWTREFQGYPLPNPIAGRIVLTTMRHQPDDTKEVDTSLPTGSPLFGTVH
ncbi:hypothetical protein A6X21_05135 [Planctopirus hydrillae]|uniref:Uncharacterized protein n=1 Tax=Planctopirus hydrillae TaxID=1841610 RepID=A0A1C3EIT3_9PLAN|nr:hypothetical protein A6X21_05135 [Planctopirus hydrillae]